MGLFKNALIGAALYGAYKYVTKKDKVSGRSIVDEVKEKAPEWIDKAKGLKREFDAKKNSF